MQPMHGSRVWQAVLEDLHGRTPRGSYETFLRSTEIAAFDADDARLTVAAPNTFVREQLEKRFHGPIVRSLRGILGYEVAVDFTVLGRPAANGAAAEQWRSRGESRRRHSRRLPPHRSTWPPSSNISSRNSPRRPRTASTRATPSTHLIVKRLQPHGGGGGEGRSRTTPAIPITRSSSMAASGLGKTHILHAIGHEAMELHPGCRVLYVSSETFTNEMINAIRENRNEEFRARYRTIDVLLIDDIQFIAGKESTQEEFFHTFNALVLAGKQVVMTSDRHPKVMVALEDRLRSRFEGGLTTDVQSPDLESRMAILRQRGEESGVHVPTEVVDYIAHKIQSNVRELEGALNRIVMMARMNGVAVTMDVATQALNDVALNNRRRLITPARIVEVIAKFYNVSEKDMRGKGRSKDIVVPRQVAMYIIRQETDRSLAEVGAELGGRDHTTIIYGAEKIEQAIETSNQLRQEVLTIREMLYAD